MKENQVGNFPPCNIANLRASQKLKPETSLGRALSAALAWDFCASLLTHMLYFLMLENESDPYMLRIFCPHVSVYAKYFPSF